MFRKRFPKSLRTLKGMGAQRQKSKRRKINEIWFQNVAEKVVIKKPKYLIKASQKLDAKKKKKNQRRNIREKLKTTYLFLE